MRTQAAETKTKKTRRSQIIAFTGTSKLSVSSYRVTQETQTHGNNTP